MTADTTLAPCPFCDTPARQSQGGEGAAAWFGTGCGGSQSCPAYLRGLVHKSQAAADAAWNRRAQVPASQGSALVPLTDGEIWDWWRSENGFEDCDLCKFSDFSLFVRAVEARKHGVTGAPNGKPT